MQTDQLFATLSHASVVTGSPPNVSTSFLNNIMDQGRSTGAQQPKGLRERNVQRPNSTGGRDALTATGELEAKNESGKDKKTFGRTPDGTGRCSVQLPIDYRPVLPMLCIAMVWRWLTIP
jgi:hypothetical protein